MKQRSQQQRESDARPHHFGRCYFAGIGAGSKSVGLTQFGVNISRIEPGQSSALRHWHEQEDEFIYMLEGELVLIENDGETVLKPGDAAGFKAAAMKFSTDVKALDKTTDQASFATAFGDVTKDCGGCHGTYRVKKQ